MTGGLTDAEWVGLSLVLLGIVLLVALFVRRHVRVLAATDIPGSVIAGFLLLFLGPQVLGHWTGSDGLVPQELVDTLSRLPGLMINIVFACVMIAKVLPSVRDVWRESAPHVILGSIFSFGSSPSRLLR